MEGKIEVFSSTEKEKISNIAFVYNIEHFSNEKIGSIHYKTRTNYPGELRSYT